MEITENKFVFHQEPAENGWWLSTLVLETVNCVLGKIHLFQEIEEDTFPTPVGMASAAAGSLSHNHITLVWDKSFMQKTTLRLRLLESGIGSIFSLGSSGKLRLHDEGKELEFQLEKKQRCPPPKIECDRKVDSYDVIGQPKLFVMVKVSTSEKILLFIKDQLIDYSNDLVRVIENLQCDSRKAMRQMVISTAQYNGWLAASMVRLPKCTKLTAYGKTALAISCNANEELVPFVPCYWTTGFVNFNDKPYGYLNNTWYPIKAKIVIPQKTLAHSFRCGELRYFDYLHQTNPANNKMFLDRMNVLAEIVATINDHSSENFSSSHVPRTNKVLIEAQDNSEYPNLFEMICRSPRSRSHAQSASEMELRGVIQRGRERCNGSYCSKQLLPLFDVIVIPRDVFMLPAEADNTAQYARKMLSQVAHRLCFRPVTGLFYRPVLGW
ncbi:hypothetical protein DAPPUDRAFT_109346 [Daphnia pulex]|uniref:Uncharacterized protein n=1 Tax=Daphnia pulex TaxID=6669 RepID=E9H2R2_DAPPU|nr:hypothetical protein DAPPUDRAFT_109346 [Daphnia pulex]|eukprot:EFX74013.1 hypothetical protein DAPPUDRAFT_109346 [Daphnia pulex]